MLELLWTNRMNDLLDGSRDGACEILNVPYLDLAKSLISLVKYGHLVIFICFFFFFFLMRPMMLLLIVCVDKDARFIRNNQLFVIFIFVKMEAISALIEYVKKMKRNGKNKTQERNMDEIINRMK